MAYNKVILMGRLTRDPETKTTNSGKSVVSFTIAVDRRYAPQGEEKKTDFFNCTAWSGTGDFVAKYFSKGSLILVEGELQNDQYTDKEGNNRTATKINVGNVTFAGGKSDNANNTPSTSTEPRQKKQGNFTTTTDKASEKGGFVATNDDDEDYPF